MAKTVEEYKQQLIDLLPPGKAFPRVYGNNQDKVFTAIAEELARVDQRGDDLLRDAYPDTTQELLEDWERVASLPSGCMKGISQTVSQRRLALVAKLTDAGESTLQSLIDTAAAIGYEITITEYSMFEAGISAAGDAISNGDWVFVLMFNAPETTITEFTVGGSSVGDALRSWGNELLECTISEKLHAHWYAMFSYGG